MTTLSSHTAYLSRSSAAGQQFNSSHQAATFQCASSKIPMMMAIWKKHFDFKIVISSRSFTLHALKPIA